MDRAAVRRFALRDRDVVDALRQRHWVHLYREHGPEGPWQIAQALRARVQATQPDWPSTTERDDDLRDHVQLKRQLDRTGHYLSRR